MGKKSTMKKEEYEKCEIILHEGNVDGLFHRVEFVDSESTIEYSKDENQLVVKKSKLNSRQEDDYHFDVEDLRLSIEKAENINKLKKMTLHYKGKNKRPLNLPKKATVTQGKFKYQMKFKQYSQKGDERSLTFDTVEKESIGTLLRGIGVLAVCILVALIFKRAEPLFREHFLNQHLYQTVVQFREKFQELERSFPDQHKFSMNVLRNSGSRHLKKVHDQDKKDLAPSSFLIVSFEESSDLVNCFANRLANAYTHGNFEEIDSGVFEGGTDIAKKQLDDAVIKNLNSTQKVVVIKNIEKLSFVAAQLFMTYSDAHNTIATYPQSTIILTANLPVPSQGDRKEDEKQVSAYFKETLWKDQATIDSVAALWTRVGDGLAVLKHVEKNPCKKK